MALKDAEVEVSVAVGPPRGKSRRQPELDALRGFLLVWMTLTHLPTHVSAFSNQTVGFVSAAEGFIFLSALLCGRVFDRKLSEGGFREVWDRLSGRAVRLYGYHLFLLAVAFTLVAALAIHTQRPSLQGLVDFYLAHPMRGIVTSILLIYRPPLLDILPMYILFLAGTPFMLWAARKWSWRVVLIPSVAIWLMAQFGLRGGMYWLLIRVTHLDIPFSALGAFDLYGWQLLWVAGLWLGRAQPQTAERQGVNRFNVWFAAMLAVGFAVIRHTGLWDVLNSNQWLLITDKWHLGALRLLNFAALATLFSAAQSWLAKWIAVKPLVLLGQASLEVFCAHLLVCFAALALVDDGADAPVYLQAGIIVVAMVALYAVARLFARRLPTVKQPPRED